VLWELRAREALTWSGPILGSTAGWPCTLLHNTGGKGWCPELVHHKDITRTWTKYQAKTHLAHLKSIQNVPSAWVRKWSGHLQCSRSCDHDVPMTWNTANVLTIS